jgi:hypothetical protein
MSEYSGVRRAMLGYGVPENPPESVIHTSAYDAVTEKERARLGDLTRNEQRLFNQGGAQAVWEDRRWHAKEAGNPNWTQIGKEKTDETGPDRMVQEDLHRQRTTLGRPADQSDGEEQRAKAQDPAKPDVPLSTVRVSSGQGLQTDAQETLAPRPDAVRRGRGPDRRPRQRRKPK